MKLCFATIVVFLITNNWCIKANAAHDAQAYGLQTYGLNHDGTKFFGKKVDWYTSVLLGIIFPQDVAVQKAMQEIVLNDFENPKFYILFKQFDGLTYIEDQSEINKLEDATHKNILTNFATNMKPYLAIAEVWAGDHDEQPKETQFFYNKTSGYILCMSEGVNKNLDNYFMIKYNDTNNTNNTFDLDNKIELPNPKHLKDWDADKLIEYISKIINISQDDKSSLLEITQNNTQILRVAYNLMEETNKKNNPNSANKLNIENLKNEVEYINKILQDIDILDQNLNNSSSNLILATDNQIKSILQSKIEKIKNKIMNATKKEEIDIAHKLISYYQGQLQVHFTILESNKSNAKENELIITFCQALKDKTIAIMGDEDISNELEKLANQNLDKIQSNTHPVLNQLYHLSALLEQLKQLDFYAAFFAHIKNKITQIIKTEDVYEQLLLYEVSKAIAFTEKIYALYNQHDPEFNPGAQEINNTDLINLYSQNIWPQLCFKNNTFFASKNRNGAIIQKSKIIDDKT